jgi:hypothetical protein
MNKIRFGDKVLILWETNPPQRAIYIKKKPKSRMAIVKTSDKDYDYEIPFSKLKEGWKQ